MSETFATKDLLKPLSNYPVSKGDVAGHDFHGNQYTSGQGQALSDRANELVYSSGNPLHATRRNGHLVLSGAHSSLATKLYADASRAEGQGDTLLARNLTKLAELHSKASETHTLAALAHNVAAHESSSGASGDLADLISSNAFGASDDARHAEAELSKSTPASGYNPITGHFLAL